MPEGHLTLPGNPQHRVITKFIFHHKNQLYLTIYITASNFNSLKSQSHFYHKGERWKMENMYIDDLIIGTLIAIISAAIIGAGGSFFILIRCVHKQAHDMKTIKKATAFVLRRQVQETKLLHPEKIDEIEDLEKTYKDLIDDK